MISEVKTIAKVLKSQDAIQDCVVVKTTSTLTLGTDVHIPRDTPGVTQGPDGSTKLSDGLLEFVKSRIMMDYMDSEYVSERMSDGASLQVNFTSVE